MKEEKIKCGGTVYGEGPYTIDDVTTGAVIILRSAATPEVAVMHLDEMDAPNPYELVEGLLRQFIERSGVGGGVSPDNIEALLIGGNFRENRATEEGVMVYVDHALTKEKAEEALKVCGLRVTYLETDVQATKTVKVDKAGSVHIDEQRRGLNKHDAIKSETDYYMLIGKYHDIG
ncbi:MAG: hypothetical protein KKD17_03820 [Nanoarchaeota archaeon]|nr:hypothetical protein [Nanoarchaeota archaeon]